VIILRNLITIVGKSIQVEEDKKTLSSVIIEERAFSLMLILSLSLETAHIFGIVNKQGE